MAITEVSTPPVVALAGNPMEFKFSTDEYEELFIAIHCILSVYDEDATAWVQVGNEKRLSLDSEHSVIFDASILLSWDPDKEFVFPETFEDLFTLRNSLRKIYRVTRLERYGNPQASYNSGNTSSRYALPGGLSFLRLAILNEADSSWYSEEASSYYQKFLTNTPSVKRSDPMACERLYFFHHSSFGTNYLIVDVEFTDGTTDNNNSMASISADQYALTEIQAGYFALGIDRIDPSKVVKSYTVFLTDDSDNRLTEKKTFVLDWSYYPNPRYFMFNNSFKMPEGIRFTGKGRSISKYSSDTILHIKSSDHDHSAAEESAAQILESQSWTINSGWLTRTELSLYKEFLISKRIWWIINNKAVRVIVETNKITQSVDEELLYNIELTYRLAHKNDISEEDLELNFPEDAVLGGNLYSDFTNYGTGFGVFSDDSSGIILATQNDSTTKWTISNELTGIVNGDGVVIDYNLTLYSGTAPKIRIVRTGTLEASSETVQLEEGKHAVALKVDDDSGATVFHLYVTNDGSPTSFALPLTIKKASVSWLKYYHHENNY